MPQLDVPALLQDMLKAAQGALTTEWPAAHDYAAKEFPKLLLEAEHVTRMRAEGVITDEQAALLMDMQCNASRAVLLAVKGMGLVAAQAALAAALGAVRTAVNTALGFAIL